MKRAKILSFLLIFSIFTGNADALFSKKTIRKFQFYTLFFALLDQANRLAAQDTQEYKFDYYLRPIVKLQKPNSLQFDAPHDTNLYFSVPGIASKIFSSSIEDGEGFLSMLLNGSIRVQTLEHLIQNKTDIQTTGVKRTECVIVVSEKICETIINDILNHTIRNNKIVRRFLRTILFTAIATGGAHLRQVLAEDALKDHMPKLSTTALNKLIEMLVVETGAELIKRYIITDTIKEKKKKLKQKHQAIFSNQISSLVRKKKDADYLEEEEEEEKAHFLCSPA